MRARDVIGRTIVRVKQWQVRRPSGERVMLVAGIELDDGTLLRLGACEMEDSGPIPTMTVERPRERDHAEDPV